MICFKCIDQNILNHPVRLFPPEADAIGSFIILLYAAIMRYPCACPSVVKTSLFEDEHGVFN